MKEQAPSGRDVARIRESLAKAAPLDVGSATRAESVMRRSRGAGSRSGLIGAVAVGVAAAAVIVGPQFIDTSPVTNSDTDASNGAATAPPSTSATNEPASPYPDAYLANPCPESPIEVSASGDPVLEVQPTAVMVRLCRARGDGSVSAWEPPKDALVYQLDGFRARVAELPLATLDPCPTARPAPQPFALQVTDSGGSTRTLSSLLTTCGTVKVNSRRVSAEALLDVFAQSLTAQRAVSDFQPDPDEIAKLACSDPDSVFRPGWLSEITSHTRFVAAITCMPSWASGSDEDQKPTPASDAALDLLNQEWAAHARDLRSQEPLDVDRCPAAAVASGVTYLVTTRGDVEPMRMVMCGNARIGDFQLIPSKELLDGLMLPYLPGLNWTVPGN